MEKKNVKESLPVRALAALCAPAIMAAPALLRALDRAARGGHRLLWRALYLAWCILGAPLAALDAACRPGREAVHGRCVELACWRLGEEDPGWEIVETCWSGDAGRIDIAAVAPGKGELVLIDVYDGIRQTATGRLPGGAGLLARRETAAREFLSERGDARLAGMPRRHDALVIEWDDEGRLTGWRHEPGYLAA